MPQKQWAIGEEVLAADFNPYVQNQVVPQFASATQRDSQWPSPPEGALCVTVDTDTLWHRIGSAWVNRTTPEPFRSVATPGGGALAGTETLQAQIVVPNIAYGHRLRYQFVCNYSWSAAGTVDQHIRWNATGAAPVVGDTLVRQTRIQSQGAAGQGSMIASGAIDRAGGGSTTISAWALTSGFSVTVSSDPTLAQLEVWAVPL